MGGRVRRFGSALVLVPLATLTGAGVLSGSASSAGASGAVTTASNPNAFTRGLRLLDDNNNSPGAAEPSIRVDHAGHVYVTGPVGVPNGGCPFWRIHPDSKNAQGKAYEYLGTFDTDHAAPGGGDCDIATGGAPPANGFDNVAVSSLSLANLTVNRSSDGGTTFMTPANPVGTQAFVVDREWQATDDGLNLAYLTVHTGDANIAVAVSTDGGYTYTTNSTAITPSVLPAAENNNHFGNIVVDPRTHKLYIPFVAPASAAENAASQANDPSYGNEHVAYVAVGDPCPCTAGTAPGAIKWTNHVVYTAPTGDDLDHIFPAVALDKTGNAYITWSDSHRVFLTHSTDDGRTWSTPEMLGNGHSDMFPWLAAGKKGAVDLVWYQASTDPNSCASGPTNDSQGVNNNCHDVWDVEFWQTLDGLDTSPTWRHGIAASSIHLGSLCDNGTTCSGDRTLLDFFQVALDPLGAANIAFASDSATPGSASIIYTRQCAGLSATSRTAIKYPCAGLGAPPPPPPPPVCSGTNAITDPAGDANNPSGAGGSTDQVDITHVSFSNDATTITTTMQLVNLTTTPVAATADTYYTVVWNGTKWYATQAVEPAPDKFAYTYGEWDPSASQFVSGTPVATTGSFTTGPDGTVSVNVPRAAVGNPPIPASTAATAAVQQPYGQTQSGEGVVGAGLIFTHPDDRAPDVGGGPAWSVC